MRIQIALSLPRDAATVPVARHLCGLALQEVGATADCTADVQLVVSEACANVLDHAGSGNEYEVKVDIDREVCHVRVVDKGGGFDAGSTPDGSDLSTERGRGIPLMRALVDRLDFATTPGIGTVVHLEKALTYAEDALARRA